MSDFKNAWPSPEQERSGAWRRMSLIVQIVFFVLTVLAVVAGFWFFDLLRLPKGWIMLIGCIAVAEWLIRGHHFWRTGVESALWLGGLYAFIFSLPSTGKPEAILVFAGAAAIAGWRVRNALFGTLAAVLITAYFAARDWPWTAMEFAAVVSFIALFAVTRAWKRPSTDLLWQMLLVVMPIAGYVPVADHAPASYPFFVGMAIVFASVAVRRRLLVPFLSCAAAIAIAAIDVHTRIPMSLEIQLIVAGAVVLATAAAITRVLRRKDSGFVLDMREPSDVESVLTGVAPSLLPVHAQGSGGLHPQGGEFGGAGASGDS